ncbi:MAG: DUF1722 domain-containing protein [Desulfobacterium sp.]|nr:DUF1722 domain-containing protein [Desulfobacterium sp.]MBU3948938.1 DUF1722 domain-containing protein [Pseudomonadota bacterium]MBU4009230.1 DUF1722 domain-containing protein [Pseudomonadota bacterium]MBU4035775.1 DUF1722 domain-containing protein [Pseudomonadota bacterium]
MRIWDINPGYLNNRSLLGEHRELHAIASIISNNKKGYSRHPETLRWKAFGWALCKRHALLVSEMYLRNFKHYSAVALFSGEKLWPENFIDSPGAQFAILEEKYKDRPLGRIPLPGNTQDLWAQHKYSVMARNQVLYKSIGNKISNAKKYEGFDELALELTKILQTQPAPGNLRNTLEHMWGHVSEILSDRKIDSLIFNELLSEIQRLAVLHKEPYLMVSTALCELRAWI